MPRSTIFGYVEKLTSDQGHGHPLPKNNDPFREWMASLWECQLKKGFAQMGVSVELPRLRSRASALKCSQIFRQHGLWDDIKLFDDLVEMRTKYSDEDVAIHMSGILKGNGVAVVVCVVDGEVSVFTRKLGTKFPDEFLAKCRNKIRIMPETPVAWYRTVDAQPVETQASVALYGQASLQSKLPIFTGSKLHLLRQRFLGSNRFATTTEQEASYQI